MPKPPEIFIKTTAWICAVTALISLLFGFYEVTRIFGDNIYAADIGKLVGPTLIILSCLLFSVGAILLNLKGAKVYKGILAISSILIILLFLAGIFQFI